MLIKSVLFRILDFTSVAFKFTVTSVNFSAIGTTTTKRIKVSFQILLEYIYKVFSKISRHYVIHFKS